MTKLHLQSVNLLPFNAEEAGHYPFNVRSLQALSTLEFTAPVTFLVGENGSGKSTFLEALANAAASIAAGSHDLDSDQTLKQVKKLAGYMRLSWTKRTRKGFFLRAEDYFGYARRLAQIREGLEQDVREVQEEFKGRSKTALGYALMPLMGELHALQEKYSGDLDNYSHGESFFTFFKARFVPGGLYLLDEPEAPLSPLRQLGFLSMLREMVEQHQAQFIIATHSPILMAFPDAVILSFDQSPAQAVAYDDLEHVTLTRAFLNNPASFLQHL